MIKQNRIKIIFIPFLLIVLILLSVKKVMGAITPGGNLLKDAGEFIKIQEGWAPVAKWDYKQNTNGYGTKALRPGEPITRQEAQFRLDKFISNLISIMSVYKTNLNHNQKIAFIDFGFNCGEVPYKLNLKRMSEGWTLAQMAAKFKEYNLAGGQVNKVLVERRNREIKLFTK